MSEGPVWEIRIIINPADWLKISWGRGLNLAEWCIRRPLKISRVNWGDYGYE